MTTSPRRLLAVLATAALLVGGAIAVSASSSSTPAKAGGKLHPPAADLRGIPEHKGVLGSPDAPVTLTEFVDPQCPICAAAARQVLPGLVADYVRTGKVKLDARVLSFLGPDSVKAARYVAGARAQSRLWPFLETIYANQGEENSGYMTHAYLQRIATAAGAALRDGGTADLRTADADAEQLGVTGTPTFVLTRKDGTQQVVAPSKLGSVL